MKMNCLVVSCLTALLDSISVYIDLERGRKKREKNIHSNHHPHLLQAQLALALLLSK